MWQKYVTRRVAIQVSQAWNHGWGSIMHKELGISVNKILVFFDGKKTEYHVDKNEFEKYIADLHRLLRKSTFLETFNDNAQKELERILQIFTEKLTKDFSSYSNTELVALYRNFIVPNHNRFYIYMWTIFNIAEPTLQTVKCQIEKYISDPHKVQNILLQLSEPLQPNDVLQERMDLLKIAKRINNTTDCQLTQLLNEHSKRYQHIPMFDFDHDPYTRQDFEKQLHSIRKPSAELHLLQREFKTRQRKHFQTIQITKPDKQLRLLLTFLQENVRLRDYRDMLRQKLNMQLRTFYLEVAQRLGLTITQVALLTNDEIIKYLNSDTIFDKRKIRKPKHAFLLIQCGNNVQLFTGADALAQAEKNLRISQKNTLHNIKGITGSPGKVRGKARIIFTNRDLHTVKKGDILITTMTRQDFVPAIRKAAAIITDEGGITCHAAIIARELNKPCIVASKHATEAFKNGEKVSVNADAGTVQKI